MAKPAARKLNVIKNQSITPNMRRLTLGGAELADFPLDQEGVYVKLMFPQGEESKPLVRTYTIIQQRSDLNELDIDFVVHPEPHGPASKLAMEAKLGDEVLLAGPGAEKAMNTEADWFLIAGDMTALPAMTVILKNLPEDSKGYVVINIMHEDDKQDLVLPTNMIVQWLSPSSDIGFEETVKSLVFMDGTVSVWVACEFTVMRALRKYFKFERLIDKSALYISSYWKQGIAEDKHKVVKREDREAQDK